MLLTAVGVTIVDRISNFEGKLDMSKRVAGIRQSLRDHAEKHFLSRLEHDKNYKVRQIHHGSKDVCKVWRCGSSKADCHFFVIASPGTLTVRGGMGTHVWSCCTDMIEFARETLDDLDYFSGKLVVSTDPVDWVPELVENWLDVEIKANAADLCLPWDETADLVLRELKCIWNETADAAAVVSHCHNQLGSACFGGSANDPTSQLKYYSFAYLWSIAALRWFLSKLKDGDILPPELPDEEVCVARAIESAEQLRCKFGIVESIKFPDLGQINSTALPVVDLSGHRWEVITGVDAATPDVLRVVWEDSCDGQPYTFTVVIESYESGEYQDQLSSVFVGEKYTVVVAYLHGYDCGPCLIVLENKLRESLESDSW